MKIILSLMVCLIGSYIGQYIFGNIPIANWLCGALTGICSLTIWIYQ